MLIEFSVANFMSVRDRQTFSLCRGRGDELVETNTFKAKAASEFELLRSAAIYGPNASGKSNFVYALRIMQVIVRESATGLKRGDDLPVMPFRLNQSARRAPSEFEVSFIVDGVRYQYGFSATTERVHQEWLLAYPKGRPQHWFGREWNEHSDSHDWDLGNNLIGEKKLWKKSTRDNALFLSTAVQLNSEQLRPVYDWFDNTLRMSGTEGLPVDYSAKFCEGKQKAQILKFLGMADLNIADIMVEKRPFDIDTLPEEMPAAVKEAFIEDLKDKQFVEIKTVHKGADGEAVLFDFNEESIGTQKFFAYAGPLISVLNNGCVMFIDELHNSLHPKLVWMLVNLFHSNEYNPKNAQLVFTTHETSILNQEVFRRDQIWFCEKGEEQETNVYPLTDFSPRKGRENLELAYLSGRYGALPYLRPHEHLT